MKIIYKSEKFNPLTWQKVPKQKIKELEEDNTEYRRTINNMNDLIDLLEEKIERLNLLLSAKNLKNH